MLYSCQSKEQDNTTLFTKESQQVIALGDFDDIAGDFVDQEVKVKGIVDHVCKHGGKKLLLVNDDGDVHVKASEERFKEELIGEEIMVTGIVEEFRVDEGYCLQMDEDNMNSHKEGKTDSELYEKKKHNIQAYRDSMTASGVDHLSFYSLVFVSYEIIENDQEIN